MPSKLSLISDVSGDITIQGGSFTLNAQQTTLRKRLTRRDFSNLRTVLDSANAKQNGDLGQIVESRMRKFSKRLEEHQNAAVVRRLQPPDDSARQDTAHALLSKAQQLVRLLPAAHRDLALQFAGAFRPHTSTRRFGDNFVLVCAPLLSSSILSTFSGEVQFMVSYFMVAMILVDLFHPRLIHRPSSRVNVLDALGKYHDFPWSACENPTTFHTEFLYRFLNQTGFSFVKSRLYEVEYDGCIMKTNDWATVKPFTDLFVNFVLIQQGGPSRVVVRCPWCRCENPLPSFSGSEESTTKCSCSECGRDFSAAVGSSVEGGGGQHTLPPGSDKSFSVEIRRFRIRLQRRKPILPTTSFPIPTIQDVTAPLPYNPSTPTNTQLPNNELSVDETGDFLSFIDIVPPTPNSPYLQLSDSDFAFLSPNHQSVHVIELPEFDVLSPDVVHGGSTGLAASPGDNSHHSWHAIGDAHIIHPLSPHSLQPNASDLYGGSSGDPSFVEVHLDAMGDVDERFLPDWRPHPCTEDNTNILGLWGVPTIRQPSLDGG